MRQFKYCTTCEMTYFQAEVSCHTILAHWNSISSAYTLQNSNVFCECPNPWQECACMCGWHCAHLFVCFNETAKQLSPNWKSPLSFLIFAVWLTRSKYLFGQTAFKQLQHFWQGKHDLERKRKIILNTVLKSLNVLKNEMVLY